MFNIVIFGAPGSGKGTQSERLIEEYGLYHISTGEVLRDHIARGTELGKIADSFISQGQLIPDELMVNILEHDLTAIPRRKEGSFRWIPPHYPQAQALSKMLESRNSKLHAVVGLEVDDSELVERLIKRGKDSGRSDDNPETINRRLEVYHNQTSPLRDFYKKEGTYHAIPGTGSVDGIFDTIKKSLDRVIELETADSNAF